MRQVINKFAEKIIKLLALSSIIFLLFIFLFLFFEGYKFFISYPLGFLGTEWQPTSENPRYGILPLILASLLITFGALFLSVPLGVGCAIYLAEISPPWLGEGLKPIIEILAGIPSVVYGFFALSTIAPIIANIFGLPSGLTALNGILVLTIMVLPIIESISEDAIRSVPSSFREASLALGATKWQTIKNVVLPAAFSGISAGILLGFGRAIGETMVVLMATGNAPLIPTSVLDPVRTLTATIAVEMGEVGRGTLHYHSLFAIGCALFLITFVTNIFAERIRKRRFL